MKIPLKSGDMNLYALIGPSPLKIEEKRCKNLQGSKKSFNESSMKLEISPELSDEKLSKEDRYTDDENHNEVWDLEEKFVKLFWNFSFLAILSYKKRAAAISVRQMRKAPHIPQPNRIVETWKNKLDWTAPVASWH